jgi:hypothetical protein
MSVEGIPAIAAIVMAIKGSANKAESFRLYISRAMAKKTKRQAQPIAIGFISCKMQTQIKNGK